ncbi:MAG: DNA methyltransferase [Candidatus Hydromicrobium americanum]|nr:MAG: DNA methyltransferase [Candidatus Hydromicrobium americanum]
MLKLKEVQEKYCVAEKEVQYLLFDPDAQFKNTSVLNVGKTYYYTKDNFVPGFFQIQNRRYLGNKYKLTAFISDILSEKCGSFQSLCDIFAGTGIIGNHFNKRNVRIISNDFLYSNYVALRTFMGITNINLNKLKEKITLLNLLKPVKDNYFSLNFGNTYFTLENARKIGAIREKIEELSVNEDEKLILITSLIYAVDKVANTVGHYDAFRKKLDTINPLILFLPNIRPENNYNNEIYCEDANRLMKRITCDVLYIDPPYNSRQYCDAYHLLENLARWDKPNVYGVAKKMYRGHLKSDYCLKSATKAFAELIRYAKCKHILVSYNNTGESKDSRSNARIKDSEIVNILKIKGEVQIFERNYKAFTTGKSVVDGHAERIFYCKVS